jgi:hypothetical protein
VIIAPRIIASIGVMAVVALLPVPALACGAAYPGGPMVCNIERDAPRRHERRILGDWPIARVFASWAHTSTALRFSGDRRVGLTRHAAFVGTELPLRGDLGLQLGAGGVMSGEIDGSRLGPGATVFFGSSYRAIDERDAPGFLQMNLTFSATRAATEAPGNPLLTAFDLRLAAIAGSTIANFFTPYAVARAFGGPVYWTIAGTDVIGTDVYKYQLGGGMAFAFPSRVIDLFVEGIALGERGIAAGIGTTFF